MQSFISFYNQLISEGVPNPAMVGDQDIEKFEKMVKKGGKDKAKLVDALTNAFKNHEKPLQKAMKDFERLIKKESRKFKKSKFISGAKPMTSIIDKAVDRGKGLLELNDLVRGAVLFDTKKEADDFVNKLMRRNKGIIAGYEEKKRGSDNTYGYYGSHHIDLNINGYIAELQVMTRKLWQYKHEAHKIYTQNRSKADGPDNFDKYTSKKIFSIANQKSESVELEFEVGELHEMQFEDWNEVV